MPKLPDPKGHPVKQEVWEQQYQAGRWKYLRKIEEMGRYGIISAYVRRDSDRPRVLDVGGGEGILWDYLDSGSIERYVSLDLAESAFQDVKVPPEKSAFWVGDMDTYEVPPEEKFTSVVFNEVLYFASEPMKTLEKYARLIDPSGSIIISMWHAPDPNTPFRKVCDSIWAAIDKGPWPILDESAVTNVPTARTWRVRALKVGPV